MTSQQLAQVAGHADYVGTYAAATARLTATAGDHETWLVMGAGSVTSLAHDLAAWVRARTP